MNDKGSLKTACFIIKYQSKLASNQICADLFVTSKVCNVYFYYGFVWSMIFKRRVESIIHSCKLYHNFLLPIDRKG